MKTLPTPDNRRNERGFMVIALLGILALLLIYSFANVQTLNILSREFNVVQKEQIQRWRQSKGQSHSAEPVKRQLATRFVDHD